MTDYFSEAELTLISKEIHDFLRDKGLSFADGISVLTYILVNTCHTIDMDKQTLIDWIEKRMDEAESERNLKDNLNTSPAISQHECQADQS